VTSVLAGEAHIRGRYLGHVWSVVVTIRDPILDQPAVPIIGSRSVLTASDSVTRTRQEPRASLSPDQSRPSLAPADRSVGRSIERTRFSMVLDR